MMTEQSLNFFSSLKFVVSYKNVQILIAFQKFRMPGADCHCACYIAVENDSDISRVNRNATALAYTRIMNNRYTAFSRSGPRRRRLYHKSTRENKLRKNPIVQTTDDGQSIIFFYVRLFASNFQIIDAQLPHSEMLSPRISGLSPGYFLNKKENYILWQVFQKRWYYIQ